MKPTREKCDLFNFPDYIGQYCGCKPDECRYLEQRESVNKRPKCYISGKITGLDYHQAWLLFEEAEKEVYELGYIAVNPMKLEHDHDQSWESYMKDDIKALCDCKAIFLLTNWKDSKGSVIENDIAKLLKLEIIHQNDNHDKKK